jgi:hypothetical protein
MKLSCLTFLLLTISGLAFSQTISINGIIKNTDGQPVPLAFVRDLQHYYATYADSSGTFLLKADPSSTLVAIATGYADRQVKIENKNTITIVMVKVNT